MQTYILRDRQPVEPQIRALPQRARMAMTAITTNNLINVNATTFRLGMAEWCAINQIKSNCCSDLPSRFALPEAARGRQSPQSLIVRDPFPMDCK